MEETNGDMTETIGVDNGVIHLGPPEGVSYNVEEKRDDEVKDSDDKTNVKIDEVAGSEDVYEVSESLEKNKRNIPSVFSSMLIDGALTIFVFVFTFILWILSVKLIKPNSDSHSLYKIYFGVYIAFSLFVLLICCFLKIHTISMQKFYRNFLSCNGKYSNLSSKSKRINRICEAYKNSFLVSGDEDYHKTRANSDLYFGSDTWLQDINPLPLQVFLKIIPSTFIGFGILGTFIGFSLGLDEINVVDADMKSITDGVQLLLNGLKNAFNTSIVGVFASVYLNFIVIHPFLNKLGNVSKQLCDYLDCKFYVTEVDAMAILDENHNMKPFPVVMNEVMSKLENVSSNINHLGNTVGSQVTDSIRQTLDDTIEGIIRGEINKLKEELGSIIDTLKDCSSQLQAAPENLKEASGIMRNTSLDLIELFKKQSEESRAALVQTIDENINSKFENYLHTMNEISSVMAKVNEGMEKLPANFLSITDSIDATSQRIVSNSDALSMAFNQSTQTLANTTEITDKIVKAYESQVSVIDNSAAQIEKVINESNQVTRNSKELLDGYSSVDEHLAKIFAEINKSTEKYSSILSENLTSYFQRFHDATKDISKQFADATLQLSEEIEKLNVGK